MRNQDRSDALRFGRSVRRAQTELRRIISNLDIQDICHMAGPPYLGVCNFDIGKRRMREIIKRSLPAIINANWYISDHSIFDSYEAGESFIRNHKIRGNPIRVFFYRADGDDTGLAYTNDGLRSIGMVAQEFDYEDWFPYSLDDLINDNDIQHGTDLEDIYNTITPTLLHECLHLIRNPLCDVSINVSDLPDWVDQDALGVNNDQDEVRIYSDHKCRMLSGLAREGFRDAYDASNGEYFPPALLPFQNSENVTRAILSLALSNRLTRLNFFDGEGEVIWNSN